MLKFVFLLLIAGACFCDPALFPEHMGNSTTEELTTTEPELFPDNTGNDTTEELTNTEQDLFPEHTGNDTTEEFNITETYTLANFTEEISIIELETLQELLNEDTVDNSTTDSSETMTELDNSTTKSPETMPELLSENTVDNITTESLDTTTEEMAIDRADNFTSASKPELLPDYMVGNFKMESSTGFNNFMWQLSVDWFTRQIANTLYPLQKISQDKETGEISLDTETTFKSSTTKFVLNEPWTEYTLDKRTTTTVSTLEGSKLIKDQVPDASTGYLTTREVREFKDEDGDGVYETMVYTGSIEGYPEYSTIRIYKRVASK